MKKIITIGVLLILAIIFFSCQKETIEEVGIKSLKIVSFNEERIKFTLVDSYQASPDHLVQILGEGIENSEVMESIFLDGIPDLTGENLRVEIYGEIRNFEILALNFEENSEGNLVEITTEKYDEIGIIKNKVMIINTYFSEGIPRGKMQWENKNGKGFEYYFSQEGYGIDGEIIISE